MPPDKFRKLITKGVGFGLFIRVFDYGSARKTEIKGARLD
jgi:hypothetical protein